MRNDFEVHIKRISLSEILKFFSHAEMKVPHLSILVFSITDILIENFQYKYQPNLASLRNTWKITQKQTITVLKSRFLRNKNKNKINDNFTSSANFIKMVVRGRCWPSMGTK